ncbi:Tfp assembly type protein [Planococcus glaciei]|uniref:prepilin-type N-terminal cleavage/methylation domain-containing protein n=1 Tax=Planococcus glaciei TaxID=459472 RepID=UPI00069E79F6|nr:prepilin-type N-terminal cleavage/methylation domain-containing protein [Planococcus glaciei]KOF11788.1 Tfp assembly type protein [Planococcus glaciei]
MKKFLQKKLKDQKGMTLIELLAVIVIIAIIAAIAIPAIGNIIENSRYSAVKADAQNVLAAANIYYTENPGAATVGLTDLQTDGYLESFGNFEGTDEVTKPTSGPITFTNATAITYSGTKTLKFTNATVDNINADTNKGSDAPASVVIGTP